MSNTQPDSRPTAGPPLSLWDNAGVPPGPKRELEKAALAYPAATSKLLAYVAAALVGVVFLLEYALTQTGRGPTSASTGFWLILVLVASVWVIGFGWAAAYYFVVTSVMESRQKLQISGSGRLDGEYQPGFTKLGLKIWNRLIGSDELRGLSWAADGVAGGITLFVIALDLYLFRVCVWFLLLAALLIGAALFWARRCLDHRREQPD